MKGLFVFFLNTFLAGRKGVFLKVKMFKINRGIGTRLFLLLFLGVFLDCLVLCGRSPERAKKKPVSERCSSLWSQGNTIQRQMFIPLEFSCDLGCFAVFVF